MTRHRRALRAADVAGLAAVGAWLLWVLSMPLWTGRSASVTSAHVVAPLLVTVGVMAGRLLAPLPRRWRLAELFLVASLLFVLGSNLYPNAQGAVGVQLVAISGLLLHTGLLVDNPDRGPVPLFAAAVALLVVGVLLAARSDAASFLVVPMALLMALSLGYRSGPPRGITALVSTALLALATISVGWLATVSVWPARLRANQGLSQVRHTLWSDALELWRQHPWTGAGPGAFREYSELAASDTDLATVHSSVLQVGSELGLVGCALFAVLLLAGLGIAAQGQRAAALIGMAAWTALGIHSSIDHLYEFPAVTLTAGLVLGWASSAPSREQRP